MECSTVSHRMATTYFRSFSLFTCLLLSVMSAFSAAMQAENTQPASGSSAIPGVKESSSSSQITFTTTPASPQPANTPISITASVNGLSNVKYQFWVYNANTTPVWNCLRAYTSSATCTWTPSTAGNYLLSVTARENSTGVEHNSQLWYTIVALPLTSVSVSASPIAPQPINTPIKLTATALGGKNVQYQFWVYSPLSNQSWKQLQAYSSSATCCWKPSAAGDYMLSVTARDGITGKEVNQKCWYIIDNRFNAPMVTVTSLADAQALNYPLGVNQLTWQRPAQPVLAYLIYRLVPDFPDTAPIAVVDGNTNTYLDSGNPLPFINAAMESVVTQIAIDPNRGALLQYSTATSYANYTADYGNAHMTLTPSTFTITSHRQQIPAGIVVSYQIRALFADISLGGASPRPFVLSLSDESAMSSSVALTMPPSLLSPDNSQSPSGDIYTCTGIAVGEGKASYHLQLSADPTFSNGLDPVTGHDMTVDSDAVFDPNGCIYVAKYSTPTLIDHFGSTMAARTIYWRMGARIDNMPVPVGLSDLNQNGWVYSSTRTFTIPATTPPSK